VEDGVEFLLDGHVLYPLPSVLRKVFKRIRLELDFKCKVFILNDLAGKLF
jgi:hypothetical protein